MMKKYETMLLFTPELSDSEAQASLEQIKEKISKEFSGEITFSDWWGMRKIEYPIKKMETGYYAVIQYTFPGEKMAGFDEDIRLHSDVLRFLTITAPDGEPMTYTQVKVSEEEFIQEKKAGKRKVRTGPKRVETLDPKKNQKKASDK